MSSRYGKIKYAGASPQKAWLFISKRTPTGQVKEVHTLNPTEMRNEMAEGHSSAKKRQAEEAEEREQQKLQCLELPTQDGSYEHDMVEAEDILVGNVMQRNEGFRLQLNMMADAYMAWDASLGEKGLDAPAAVPSYAGETKGFTIQVVDIFRCIEEALASRKGLSDDAENPCATWWTNMVNEMTAQMCFVLVIADMVCSGEMAKYPLAVVEALLDAFGSGIGGGYDIGCRFKTTLAKSDLGNRAQELNYTALVNLFHGHAHNRLCQLSYLGTYVDGMGLEDLEGCECFFSKSNALAATTRHANIFHRQQSIVEFLKHMNSMETSQNLSQFLVQNYRQALNIIHREHILQQRMEQENIKDTNIFKQWLEEERAYLTGLCKEPVEETIAMDYYQSLVDLIAAEVKVKNILETFHFENTQENMASTSQVAPDDTEAAKAPGQHKHKLTPATQLRRAEAKRKSCLDHTHALEEILGLKEPWTSSSPDYQRAVALHSKRCYQECLNQLESLVVSRLFELTKINMSQTGNITV
ncbi:hypothetical protein AN958_09786 [Leucoagaricus sp. SymC.cos]|nr:hypothetical protein AN958_09786 [Leucoagaricus sp. SymC.cos]